jgi:hypothetical protein
MSGDSGTDGAVAPIADAPNGTLKPERVGVYWIIDSRSGQWEMAAWDGDEWRICQFVAHQTFTAPSHIGPPIISPRKI